MAHFKNIAIEEQNKLREVFLVWRMPSIFNCKKEEEDMFGGKENKPTSGNEKFAGLSAGTHLVYFNDMVTGVSDKTGNQYWIMKFATENGKEFDHFIACEPNEYKTEEKIYNAIGRQMDALHIYDAIGTHEKLESFVQKAIDTTYQLKGKKFEFTIKKWKMEDKEGLWGEITGYLDVPNEAIQNAKVASAGTDASSVDSNEEIPF